MRSETDRLRNDAVRRKTAIPTRLGIANVVIILGSQEHAWPTVEAQMAGALLASDSELP